MRLCGTQWDWSQGGEGGTRAQEMIFLEVKIPVSNRPAQSSRQSIQNGKYKSSFIFSIPDLLTVAWMWGRSADWGAISDSRQIVCYYQDGICLRMGEYSSVILYVLPKIRKIGVLSTK